MSELERELNKNFSELYHLICMDEVAVEFFDDVMIDDEWSLSEKKELIKHCLKQQKQCTT